MERMTERKKKAQETRTRIQGAALDLFNRNGFENVSVEEIAQAAGCSVGNIYHYFKSKDELALQLTSQVDAAYAELEKVYDQSKLSPEEKLLDFIEQSLIISNQDEVIYKSFIHNLKYPEQGILKIKRERVYFRLLKKLIDECQRAGALDDRIPAEEILSELVILHRGILFQWRIDEGTFDIGKKGRVLGEHLLIGLKKGQSL